MSQSEEPIYTDKKLKEYNEREERFRLAVEEATTNKSASINSIANKYKVSRTTLSRRIHGFKNTRNSHEKQQKFTNEEEMLIVGQIQEMVRTATMNQQQIPPKKDILLVCENLLKEKYKDRPPHEGENFFKVGKNWVDRFLERHNNSLMINDSTTLTEYYKNDFLQRKRLRTERGYKSSIDSNTSLTPTDDTTQHSSLSDPASQHHHQQHNQQPLPQRLPYQSQSEPFIYQDQVVMNPFMMPNMIPQQQQQQQPQHPQQSHHHHQPQQPQYAPQPQEWALNNNLMKHPFQQHSTPPYKQDVKQDPQATSSSANYNYSQAVNSPIVTNIYETTTQPTTTPLAPQQHQQRTLPYQSFNNFSFQQNENPASTHNHVPTNPTNPTPNQSTATGQGGSTSTNWDPLQFYHNNRFQYELSRQRILKELGKTPIEVDNVAKLVNLVFGQIERDLGTSSGNAGTSASQQQQQQQHQQTTTGGYLYQ